MELSTKMEAPFFALFLPFFHFFFFIYELNLSRTR